MPPLSIVDGSMPRATKACVTSPVEFESAPQPVEYSQPPPACWFASSQSVPRVAAASRPIASSAMTAIAVALLSGAAHGTVRSLRNEAQLPSSHC